MSSWASMPPLPGLPTVTSWWQTATGISLNRPRSSRNSISPGEGIEGWPIFKKPLARPQKRREFRAEGLDLIRGHEDSLPRFGGYYTCGGWRFSCAVVLIVLGAAGKASTGLAI